MVDRICTWRGDSAEHGKAIWVTSCGGKLDWKGYKLYPYYCPRCFGIIEIARAETCIWKPVEDIDRYWRTSCGAEFSAVEGQWMYQRCPNCGRKVEVRDGTDLREDR